MSLYIFGGIKTTPDSYELIFESLLKIDDRLNFEPLDQDDVESILCQTGDHNIPRIYFSLSDATSLWNEARKEAMEVLQHATASNGMTSKDIQLHFPDQYFQVISHTLLGHIISEISSVAWTTGQELALAVIDGAIDNILRTSISEGTQHLYESIRLPWDCLDNYLYILS